MKLIGHLVSQVPEGQVPTTEQWETIRKVTEAFIAMAVAQKMSTPYPQPRPAFDQYRITSDNALEAIRAQEAMLKTYGCLTELNRLT